MRAPAMWSKRQQPRTPELPHPPANVTVRYALDRLDAIEALDSGAADAVLIHDATGAYIKVARHHETLTALTFAIWRNECVDAGFRVATYAREVRQ